MQEIPTLGGSHGYGMDINDSGQVVGYSLTANNQYYRAFLYQNGSPQELGTLGRNSYAMGINNNGDVVGYSYPMTGDYHAFLKKNDSSIQDLGTIGGTISQAHDINQSRVVVGWSYTTGNQRQHAFVYDETNGMRDLNNLLPENSGWELYQATAINDSGQIVGYGRNPQGYNHAFLLTPANNAAPVAVDDVNYTTNEDSVLTVDAASGVLANDTDSNQDTLNVVAESVTAPAHGTITVNQDGSFTYTPEANYSGEDTFTYIASDNQAESNVATVKITVSAVNDAPTLDALADQTVSEENAMAVSAVGADVENDSLTYSLEGTVPAGMTINASTGTISWTPTETQGAGIYDQIVVRVTDAGSPNQSATRPFKVTVDEVNLAPVLSAIGNQTIEEGSELSFAASATDADLPANGLTYSLENAPEGATITPSGVLTWTPSEAQGGTGNPFTFTVRVTDNGIDPLSDSETISVTVSESNSSPVLNQIGSKTVDEETPLIFTASATDPDLPANSLSFSLVNAPAGATIDAATGLFSWTPTEAQGTGAAHQFTVRVTDNGTGNLTDEEVISVTVNEVNVAPTLSNVPGAATFNELTAYEFTATAADADVPAQTLTFSLVNPPAGASINPSNGAFSWTPTEAQGNGSTYNFAVRVSDGVVDTDSAIALTVNEVNSAPALAEIADTTVDELAALSGVTAVGSDTDDPANTLTYSLDSGFPAGMSIDASTGAISWTPTELQGAGDYPVTVRVTDNGDGNLSATRTFNVHVDEVNEAPELGAIGSSTIDEQAAFNFTATATDADLKTDNTPANNLTFSLENAPSGATISASGTFSWTPTEAQGPGSYTFKVKVTDDGEPNLSDEETITLTVNEVNLPPVLGAISNQTGVWGNAFTFTASATDPDIPANTLTFSLVNAPAGASIDSATGAFTWTPGMSQIAAHTFTVVVTDDGTPAMADQQNVTLTVGKRPTTIVYTGDTAEQYSDQTALSATLTDTGFGTPLSGRTIGFDIGSQNASATTDSAGAASTNLILTQDPNPGYNVVSQFAGDAYYLAATDTDVFDIQHEDARAYYTGTLFVNTACATCGNATATLAATVKDITAETADPATDSFEGDIRNATVTFVNRDTTPNTPIAGCSNLPVGLVNLGDKKVGTATCNWNASINGDSMDYTIGIVVNNFYTRNSGTEDTVVTISKPLGTNFITGGGFLVNQLSNGQYAGVAGLKTNFGFNVKYNKSGTNLQGRVNVIVRGADGRVYQVKGNVMRTLSVRTVSNNPLVRAANYTGKATITDITDPLNPLPLGGNNSFQMELTDKGEPGATDSIGINVWNDAGGLLFSSRWDGTRTVEQILGGGNLVLR